MAPPLTPLALRTRWAVLRLAAAALTARPGEFPGGPPLAAMGLVFPGRLGLAAGFDRRGRLWRDGHRLGLAAVECVAPAAAGRAGRGAPVRGLSVAKPPGLPWPGAVRHFLAALAGPARHADYLVLNPGRDPGEPAGFVGIVAAVCAARGVRRLPVVAKLPAAWLESSGRVELARACVAAGAAGLLLSAEGAADPEGALRELAAALGQETCLISVGGIASGSCALARIRAGADLVQVHRGLIGRGPRLLAEINGALAGA